MIVWEVQGKRGMGSVNEIIWNWSYPPHIKTSWLPWLYASESFLVSSSTNRKPEARMSSFTPHLYLQQQVGWAWGPQGLNRAGRPSACETRNLESAKKMTQWCFQGTSVGVERVTTPTPNPKTLWPGTIQCNSHISDGKVKPYSRPHSPVTTWGQPLRCT